MKRYSVNIAVSFDETVEVEAESEDEAAKIASALVEQSVSYHGSVSYNIMDLELL